MALMLPNMNPVSRTLAMTMSRAMGMPRVSSASRVTMLGRPILAPGMGMKAGIRDST